MPDRFPLADLPGRPCSIAASLDLVGQGKTVATATSSLLVFPLSAS